MRPELGAIFSDLPAVGETEYLVPAAIGEDRMVPPDESVKAPTPGNQLVPGAEMQVIGVAENDLSARFLEVAVTHRLDAALRPDRHEGRRLYDTMGCAELPEARKAVGTAEGEFERVSRHAIIRTPT